MPIIKYFAYGSNMSFPRLRNRVTGARIVGVAKLERHKLVFHKVSKDGSGKCDIVESEAGEVLGILFELPSSEKKKLDQVEGLNYGYDEKEVRVHLSPDRKETALTYFATAIDPTIKPYGWYKRHVLEGARKAKLPKFYIEAIQAIESNADPDTHREASELAIYD